VTLIAEDLTDRIIGAAIEVHRSLGPGLLESAYEVCLVRELECRKLSVQRQVPVPIEYKDVIMDTGFRADIIVEDQVVLELKSVDALNRVHAAQLVTYLRFTKKPVGLLLNFGAARLRDGILRRVLSPPAGR